MKEASIVASAAGAPARQHLIPGEAGQARRRRRGSPPSRTASRHRDALRVSDVARRSHEHPACVPTLWVLREHVKTLDDAWRLPALYAPLQLRRFDPQRCPAIAPAADEQGADCREHADQHEHAAERRRERRPRCQFSDGTNDLVVSDVIRTNELQIWFLSEHLVDVPLVEAKERAAAAAAL